MNCGTHRAGFAREFCSDVSDPGRRLSQRDANQVARVMVGCGALGSYMENVRDRDLADYRSMGSASHS